MKAKVDTWPNPDAVTAAQVDAYSRLKRAMQGVPRHMRPIVEAVCWNNTPISRLSVDAAVARSVLQGAMTAVADHLRY